MARTESRPFLKASHPNARTICNANELGTLSVAGVRRQIEIPTVSKAEILHELPKLGLQERREIFERIGELEDQAWLKGCEPTAAEKALLDANWRTAGKNPEAGSTWPEVESRLRKPTHP